MSNKIICPRCFSQNFVLYGKDNYQKYICKNDGCNHQFTINKPKKIVLLIIPNDPYSVLLCTDIMITNIIINLHVTLKSVIIILMLLI